MELLAISLAIAGLGLGFSGGWLYAKSKQSALEARALTAEGLLAAKGQDDVAMRDAFKAVAGDVLNSNSEAFMLRAKEAFSAQSSLVGKDMDARSEAVATMLKPLGEAIDNLSKSSVDMEKEREGAYQGMKRHLDQLAEETLRLGKEANTLSTALSQSSNVRGNWGEVSLRNILELAGMARHSDFAEQSGSEGIRPDVIVRLPNGGAIPIDAKASAKHFLEAVEIDDEEKRKSLLEKHAKAVRSRVVDLSRKEYRDKVTGIAKHVIMFVPSEAIVAAAYNCDPKLHEYALSKSILVASPATLMAILQMAALQWQQASFNENALEVIDESKELYRRIAKWSEHYVKVGKNLDSAIKAYNESSSSWSSRISPQVKRIENLHIADDLPQMISPPANIENESRRPTALSDVD